MPRHAALFLALPALLGGCMAFRTPANDHDLAGPQGYMLQRGALAATETETNASVAARNLARCAAPPPASRAWAAPRPAMPPRDMPLSAGDLVRVSVAGDEAPTGTYKVSGAGTIALTGAGDLPVQGLTAHDAEGDLERLLVAQRLFRKGYAHVSLRVLDRGAARVVVTGAVFQPGLVTINDRMPTEIDTMREAAVGDHALGRTLSIALSHAAGVRPDADLAHIAVEHDGARRVVDLSGVLTGEATEDPMLAEGDRVMVPSLHCFQAALARPTPITPPGVKIFVSNLTTPATNNAGAAVGQDSTSHAYGTRMLQALVAANCVGGTKMTNADRSAVLITSNPETGESEVLERRIEALVRRPDRDAYNPVLMPGDALACYDSTVQNLRDVLASIGNAAAGFTAARVVAAGGL